MIIPTVSMCFLLWACWTVGFSLNSFKAPFSDCCCDLVQKVNNLNCNVGVKDSGSQQSSKGCKWCFCQHECFKKLTEGWRWCLQTHKQKPQPVMFAVKNRKHLCSCGGTEQSILCQTSTDMHAAALTGNLSWTFQIKRKLIYFHIILSFNDFRWNLISTPLLKKIHFDAWNSVSNSLWFWLM